MALKIDQLIFATVTILLFNLSLVSRSAQQEVSNSTSKVSNQNNITSAKSCESHPNTRRQEHILLSNEVEAKSRVPPQPKPKPQKHGPTNTSTRHHSSEILGQDTTDSVEPVSSISVRERVKKFEAIFQ